MMTKICIAILLLPALAWAQPAQSKTADEWYKEGESQYLLGNFDKAVDAFKQGFTLEGDENKRPAYLYNVAQSYRQLKDCKNALFFYKRFLSLRDANQSKPLTAKTRKDVEGWISEAETCVAQSNSFSSKPPTTNIPPGSDGGDKQAPPGETPPVPHETHKTDVASAQNPGEGQEDTGDTNPKPAAGGQPHVIRARITGGGTRIGAGPVDVPVQATFALLAGYPIAINRQLMIDVGAAFTLTPVPFTPAAQGATPPPSQTAQLIGLMADAGATYEVVPKLGVRGDLGIGTLLFNGAGRSRFIAMEADTTGALSMFHLRVALSADYAVTPNFFVTVTPVAFSFSPPKQGLDPGIKSLTSIDFMLGLGYRM